MNLMAVAKALDRAEKRILARARKAWKPIRGSALEQVKSGILSLFDISGLAEAFKVGMISAYIFGRAAVRGQWTRAIKKQFVQKREPTDDEIWVSYWRAVWAADKTLIKSLMFLRESKRVNLMDYYFRPSQAALDFLDGYTVQLAHVIERDLLRDVTSWIRDTIEQGMRERSFEVSPGEDKEIWGTASTDDSPDRSNEGFQYRYDRRSTIKRGCRRLQV